MTVAYWHQSTSFSALAVFCSSGPHSLLSSSLRNFNPLLNEYRGGANISGSVQADDQFVVWMKLAPLPKFRKIWGVINTQLNTGDVVQV